MDRGFDEYDIIFEVNKHLILYDELRDSVNLDGAIIDGEKNGWFLESGCFRYYEDGELIKGVSRVKDPLQLVIVDGVTYCYSRYSSGNLLNSTTVESFDIIDNNRKIAKTCIYKKNRFLFVTTKVSTTIILS